MVTSSTASRPLNPVRGGDVSDVVVGAERVGGWADRLGLGGNQLDRTPGHLDERGVRGGGLDPDELGGSRPGDDVRVAFLGADVVVVLDDLAVDKDVEGEHVLAHAVAMRVEDLDRNRLGAPGIRRRDGVPAERRPRRPGDRLGLAAAAYGRRSRAGAHGVRPVAVGRRTADPDDEAVAAAVLHVPVHRVREVGAGDEPAERLGELGPVGHERGLVHRALLGQADEGGDGGADPLDGPVTGLDLLDVHTRREIVRHTASSEVPARCALASWRFGMPVTSVRPFGRVCRRCPDRASPGQAITVDLDGRESGVIRTANPPLDRARDALGWDHDAAADLVGDRRRPALVPAKACWSLTYASLARATARDWASARLSAVR